MLSIRKDYSLAINLIFLVVITAKTKILCLKEPFSWEVKWIQVEKMKNKTKIFGIGVAFLIVMVALTPAVVSDDPGGSTPPLQDEATRALMDWIESNQSGTDS